MANKIRVILILSLIILLLTLLGLYVYQEYYYVSPETEAFMLSLPDIKSNIDKSVTKLGKELDEYNNEYSVTKISNLDTITDSTPNGMEESEQYLQEDLKTTEKIIDNYNTQKKEANIKRITPESKKELERVEQKISYLNEKKETLQTCIEHMQPYRDWVSIIKELILLGEELETKKELMELDLSTERFDEAKEKIDEMKNMLLEMKSWAIEIDKTGVQTYEEEYLYNFNKLANTFEYLKDSINYVESGKFAKAQESIDEYLERIAELTAEDINEDITKSDRINEADKWYQENIGKCKNLFREYP